MLRVIIADDEYRICQLIQVLADWETMGMVVVGTASNGLEAIELIEEQHPDILITDIRMPGYNGLEMIEKVREVHTELEIIIISGFAHFDYAKSAIQYGVGHYLLKPINQKELNQSLLKVAERIHKRRLTERQHQQLIHTSHKAHEHMKANLITDLLLKEELHMNSEILEQVYHFKFKEGICQVFCIKLDYDLALAESQGASFICDKVKTILYATLASYCHEFIVDMRATVGYGVMYYNIEDQEVIKRLLRDSLNQLIMQKSVFGTIAFTMAVGIPRQRVQMLGEDLRQCEKMLFERVVTGTECIIDTIPVTCGMKDNHLLQEYIRVISSGIPTYNQDQCTDALYQLQEKLVHVKNIRGYEVFETVVAAATAFLMQTDYKEQKECLELFKKRSNQCTSIDALFDLLVQLQRDVLVALKKEQGEAMIRPIRQAKVYIQNHYKEQITLEGVSEVVGLSPTYFSALFKKEVEEGFAKYLMRIRIEETKVLLRETTYSVAQICTLVGYNDLKHFTRTFEKVTGIKPSVYRKLYG